MSGELSSSEKQAILKEAKKLKTALEKEARKYANAKVKGRSKDFYDRAAKLVRSEAAQYGKGRIQAELKAGNNPQDRIDRELELQRSFNKGSYGENVARRILTTRVDINGVQVSQTSQAGARFYGGLIKLWEDAGYDKRDEAITAAFGKKNLLEVMELIEDKLDINLIDMLSDPEKYQEAVNAIQSYVAERMYDDE